MAVRPPEDAAVVILARAVEALLPLRVSRGSSLFNRNLYALYFYRLRVFSGHVRTIGVKRPGFGTGGKSIQITVNAFEAEVTNGIIYHYDGELASSYWSLFTLSTSHNFQSVGTSTFFQVTSDANRHSSKVTPENFPPRVNYLLFQALQTKVAPQVFTNGPLVYDGRKNAFSMYKLPLGPTDEAQVYLMTLIQLW